MKMTKDMIQRKREFAAALKFFGSTQGKWAAKNGITASYLSTVLNGHKESIRLLAKVDAYVGEFRAAASMRGATQLAA